MESKTYNFLDRKNSLADLHAHVSGAADVILLWKIAHEAGLKLEFKDFWDFKEHFSISDKQDFELIHKICFERDRIQSSPEAMEEFIYEEIAGAYIKGNITTLELRYNPMLRNRGGEHDLDHLIMSSLYGLDRAILAYPKVKAGILLMLDRRFEIELNKIILRKAIKYQNRGVIGIDLAGPRTEKRFDYKAYQPLFQEAREAGLGTTIHTGEEGPLAEMTEVIEYIRPQRVGHGINAYQDEKLMKALVQQNTVLEICPTSYLRLSTVKGLDELKKAIRTLIDHQVSVTINTDHPETYEISVRSEFEMLLHEKIITFGEVDNLIRKGHTSSFINDSAYYRLFQSNGNGEHQLPRRGGIIS